MSHTLSHTQTHAHMNTYTHTYIFTGSDCGTHPDGDKWAVKEPCRRATQDSWRKAHVWWRGDWWCVRRREGVFVGVGVHWDVWVFFLYIRLRVLSWCMVAWRLMRVCVCGNVCLWVWVGVSEDVYVYIRLRVLSLCMVAWRLMMVYVCVHVCLSVCVFLCVCVCVYVCVC